MTSWLPQSYMGRKAVAKGVAGRRHELNEAKQGKYHYVYGPYAEPVLRIAPGDIVVAETKDAFESRIKAETDSPTKILKIPFLNPQCGPIAVEGAAKGDVLCVYIHSIKPRGQQPIGTTALIPEFGGLVATNNTALLNPPLPERVKKMEVTEQGIKFNSSITLPYEPFIGTLGVHQRSRRLPRCSRTTTAATWTCPTLLLTRSSISRSITPTLISTSAIVTPHRETANSAGSRLKWIPRQRFRST